MIMTLALALSQAPTSASATDPPRCEVCAEGGGSYRLSEAGARKCLADEQEAARARAALAASAEATSEASASRGALAECRRAGEEERAQRRASEEEARAAAARAQLLQAQLDEARAQRWIVGGVGVGVGALVALLLASAID